jgi:hypothetical protein
MMPGPHHHTPSPRLKRPLRSSHYRCPMCEFFRSFNRSGISSKFAMTLSSSGTTAREMIDGELIALVWDAHHGSRLPVAHLYETAASGQPSLLAMHYFATVRV